MQEEIIMHWFIKGFHLKYVTMVNNLNVLKYAPHVIDEEVIEEQILSIEVLYGTYIHYHCPRFVHVYHNVKLLLHKRMVKLMRNWSSINNFV